MKVHRPMIASAVCRYLTVAGSVMIIDDDRYYDLFGFGGLW